MMIVLVEVMMIVIVVMIVTVILVVFHYYLGFFYFFLFDFQIFFVGDADRDRYERRRSPPRYRSRSPADRSPDRRRSYVLLLHMHTCISLV